MCDLIFCIRYNPSKIYYILAGAAAECTPVPAGGSRARDSGSSQPVRTLAQLYIRSCSTVDVDGAATCGNDARQAVLLEPLPSGLNQGQGRQRVSLDGHGVSLG